VLLLREMYSFDPDICCFQDCVPWISDPHTLLRDCSGCMDAATYSVVASHILSVTNAMDAVAVPARECDLACGIVIYNL
jgi:hypothetical protein